MALYQSGAVSDTTGMRNVMAAAQLSEAQHELTRAGFQRPLGTGRPVLFAALSAAAGRGFSRYGAT